MYAFFSYQTSPLICLASWMSFGIMVTLLACNTQRLHCSSKPTRNISPASYNANIAVDFNLRSSHTFLDDFFYNPLERAISLLTLQYYSGTSWSSSGPWDPSSSFWPYLPFSLLVWISLSFWFSLLSFFYLLFIVFLNFSLSAFVGVLLFFHAISA